MTLIKSILADGYDSAREPLEVMINSAVDEEIADGSARFVRYLAC